MSGSRAKGLREKIKSETFVFLGFMKGFSVVNDNSFGEIYRPVLNSTWTAWTLKMRPVGCLETSVIN
jgi:hypothetical protein